MKKYEYIDYGSDYAIIREYLEDCKNNGRMSIAGAIGSILKYGIEHDALNRGGKFSAKASERRAARRAERKAAEAASPASPASPAQEPQADGARVWRTGEEWTSSDDYKQVVAQVKKFWLAADYDERIKIHKMWCDVMEDEQAATDYLHTLQKAG